MKKIGIYVLLLLCFSLNNRAFGQGIVFEENSTLEEALREAAKQNRLVFVDCYTTWCGPCKRLSNLVFPDARVGAFFNEKFVNMKIDMEKGEGPLVAAKYGVRAYPTLLWLSPEGKVVHRAMGALDPDKLISEAKKASSPLPALLDKYKAQYSGGDRNSEFVATYLKTLDDAGENYTEVFEEWVKKLSNQDLTKPEYAELIYKLTRDIKSSGVPFLYKNKAFYTEIYGADNFAAKVNNIASAAMNQSIKAGNDVDLKAAINMLYAIKPNHHQQTITRLKMDYSFRRNEWTEYEKHATVYVKKYAGNNASLINEIAWNFYLHITDPTALKNATRWAKNTIELQNTYSNNITYAYLLYKTGQKNEAIKACDYAMLKAGEEGANPASAKSLKDLLEKEAAK